MRSLLLETLLYIPLVALYYFLVLRLMGSSLHEVAEGSAHAYALTALAILLGQAILLDALARILMRMFR